MPLVSRSAGLLVVGMYAHAVVGNESVISITRLEMNGFDADECLMSYIQCRIIWLSVHRYTGISESEDFRCNDCITNLASLVAMTAAISSNLGRVMDLTGATLDLDITNETWLS